MRDPRIITGKTLSDLDQEAALWLMTHSVQMCWSVGKPSPTVAWMGKRDRIALLSSTQIFTPPAVRSKFRRLMGAGQSGLSRFGTSPPPWKVGGAYCARQRLRDQNLCRRRPHNAPGAPRPRMCVTPILPELEYSRSSSSAVRRVRRDERFSCRFRLSLTRPLRARTAQAAGPRTIVAKDGVLYKCKGGRTVSKIALADDGVTVVKATDWAGPMPPSTHLDLAIVVMRGSAKCWTLQVRARARVQLRPARLTRGCLRPAQARSRAEMEEWYRMILFMNGGDPGASLCPAMPGDGTAHPLPADALWTGLEEGTTGRLSPAGKGDGR